eukprot:2087552-Pyramimonas_sp.AAC.1
MDPRGDGPEFPFLLVSGGAIGGSARDAAMKHVLVECGRGRADVLRARDLLREARGNPFEKHSIGFVVARVEE